MGKQTCVFTKFMNFFFFEILRGYMTLKIEDPLTLN